MTKLDHIKILKENSDALNDASLWLKRSYGICKDYDDLTNPNSEAMDAFEALTSRFARTSDLLFNKVFRSIAYISEGENRPWLDVLILMEKYGVIESAEDARIIKELRNDIVHEYILTDITILFKEVLNQCPFLLKFAENAIQESEKLQAKLKQL